LLLTLSLITTAAAPLRAKESGIDLNRLIRPYSSRQIVELDLNQSFSQGNEDVDFCQIKVYSKLNPEKDMPHIFMTCSPTENVRPNQPVNFRFWFQGGDSSPITIEFDDGTKVTDYPSYAELSHRFTPAGIHIVTARCEADGKPIAQKMKVIVTPAPQSPSTGTSPE